MKSFIAAIVTRIILPVCLLFGCGGGSDVGNPYLPIQGSVTSRLSDGPKAAGARVVLARQGTDPGYSGDSSYYRGIDVIFFDTTYTDIDGLFSFDSVPPGDWVLVATYNRLTCLEYVQHRSGHGNSEAMVLNDPSTITLKNYTELDTNEPHFRAARILGTEIWDTADANGEIALHNVPAVEKLDIVLYRSDTLRKYFSGMSTEAGCAAELYTLPDLPPERWTPHPCGDRDPLSLPYILEIITRTSGVVHEELTGNGRDADMLISFSLDMNVLATNRAIHGFAEGDTVSGIALSWDGSTLVYINFCTADSTDACRSGDDRFLPGVTYGVTIDTTAQTSEGVHFAYEEKVRFVPVQ